MRQIFLIIIVIMILGCSNNKAIQTVSKSEIGDGYINREKLEHKLDTNFFIINEDGTAKINLYTDKNDIENIEIIVNGKNSKDLEYVLDVENRAYWNTEIDITDIKNYYFVLKDDDTEIYLGENISSKKELLKQINVENFDFDKIVLIQNNEIWYQIFVDRFNNGNRKNDPLFNEFGPEECLKPNSRYDNGFLKKDIINNKIWNINNNYGIDFSTKKWEDSWFELQDWEEKISKKIKWAPKNTRHYGGDLQGIINKIEYIKELGINGVWLSPVFYSYSNHKFDIIDYAHISPDFGSIVDNNKSEYKILEEKIGVIDYLTVSDKKFFKLAEELHKNDIKIIIDVAFEYVSNRFWAFKDVLKYGKDSKYFNWFNFENVNNWEEELQYSGSLGKYGVYNKNGKLYRKRFVKIEKELSEEAIYEILKWNINNIDYKKINDDKNLVCLNLKDENLQKYLIESIKKWSLGTNETNGIDGIVINYFLEQDINFVKKLKNEIRETNEDFMIFSEKQEIYSGVDNLSIYSGRVNYSLSKNLFRLFSEERSSNKISLKDYIENIKYNKTTKREINLQNSLILLDSYNTDRFNSMLLNNNRLYDRENLTDINSNYLNANPIMLDENLMKIQKIGITLQMVNFGNPVIYYGSEAGMWGGDDPDSRKPMIWKDTEYRNEIDSLERYSNYREEISKNGEVDEASKEYRYEVKFNEEIYKWYKKLIKIRKENFDLFNKGELEFLNYDDEKSLLVIKRKLEKKVALIIVNLDKEETALNLEVEEKGIYKDLINDKEYDIAIDDYEINSEPYSVKILIKD